MTRIDLSVIGKQHFAMPGTPLMESTLRKECDKEFESLNKLNEGNGKPLEICLVGDEAAENEFSDEKERTIGELVGRILDTAHQLSPQTEFYTVGYLKEDEDGISLSYGETNITGMGDTATLINLSPLGTVTMNRSGQVSTNLVFEKKRRIQCVFQTKATAPLPVTVYTRDLKIKRGKNGGRIEIDYFIEVGGIKTEHDEFFISWKEHKDPLAGI
ncbi:MAG: DUF1934 domain-containing protein [Ruminococcaceae bacterium]|nr:DUF1934 domain-containing protein [Oscillospiraceae bacterium]